MKKVNQNFIPFAIEVIRPKMSEVDGEFYINCVDPNFNLPMRFSRKNTTKGTDSIKKVSISPYVAEI